MEMSSNVLLTNPELAPTTRILAKHIYEFATLEIEHPKQKATDAVAFSCSERLLARQPLG
jgi:hypothetical protein